MGFSLRNLLKRVVDDVNPFDGPQQRPAAPQPASTARPQQGGLSVQQPQVPNLIPAIKPAQAPPPIKVGVAPQQQLQVGEAVIQPSQTARSGVAPPKPQGDIRDALGAAGAATLSSAAKAAASTVKSAADLRFATPNFIPGIRSTLDPAIASLSSTFAKPFNQAQQNLDLQAKNNDLYGSNAGQLGKQIGNAAGTAAIYAPQIESAARGAVTAVKAAPAIVKGVENLAPKIPELVQNRQPLNQVGAVGKDISSDLPIPPRLPASAEQNVFDANPLRVSEQKPNYSPPPTTKLVSTPVNVEKSAVQGVERGSRVTPNIPEQIPRIPDAPSPEPLPIYNTKQTGNLNKAFRSTRSVIERQPGQAGGELGGLLQGARDNKELTLADWQKQLPTVTKLARKGKNALVNKDFENFVESTQGLAQPKNEKVAQAVSEWQAFHPNVRERAVSAGLDVGDLGQQYYPHFVDYDSLFKDTNTYNKAINHLVETGQAPNPEEARKLLDYAKGISRNRQFGNLEASRTVDLPFYDKTPNSLIHYLNSSAQRIAHTETFGSKDEKALRLITQIGREGGDTEAAKNAFDVAVGAKQYNPNLEKASGLIRKYTTTTRLGLGALTNVSQNVNTGIVTGHARTLLAAAKQLSPKNREFARDSGVISDALLNDLKTQAGYSSFSSKVLGKGINKITAPGFGAVEKFNRQVAATAGRDYALRLAQKGDIKTLKRLGVTGDIKGNTLTEAQQIQAARKVVEKTQFKVDPQDLPGWADSPAGKLVSQFRTFSYSQAKFVSNEILKPLKPGKGFDIQPLARLLAALPVGYGLYEAKRLIGGRPEEENPTKRGLQAFQNVGGGGLIFDLYNSLNPIGSKYIPSDRRASMALGAFAGPSAATAAQGIGALSEIIQRKNTPTDSTRLEGKVALGKNDNDYTDATPAARFGLQQIPIVGTPIKNRVLPYKVESNADAGKLDTNAPALADLEKNKKKQTANLKNSLSAEDYKLSNLSTADRQKLIDSGAYTQEKFDGLDKFVADKKQQLGLNSDKSAGKINPSTPKDSKAVLKEYDNLSTDARDKKIRAENDYEFKVALAKYDNDVADKKISKAEQSKKLQALGKAKVGSSFSKDTRETFGLSKNELADLVESDPDGNKIASDVIAYDQALTAAGFQAKNKFKNGAIARSGSSGGGRGSGKKSTAAYASSFQKSNAAGAANQSSLQKLLKGSKISSGKRSANVSRVALKKQSVKKDKVKA